MNDIYMNDIYKEVFPPGKKYRHIYAYGFTGIMYGVNLVLADIEDNDDVIIVVNNKYMNDEYINLAFKHENTKKVLRTVRKYDGFTRIKLDQKKDNDLMILTEEIVLVVDGNEMNITFNKSSNVHKCADELMDLNLF